MYSTHLPIVAFVTTGRDRNHMGGIVKRSLVVEKVVEGIIRVAESLQILVLECVVHYNNPYLTGKHAGLHAVGSYSSVSPLLSKIKEVRLIGL